MSACMFVCVIPVPGGRTTGVNTRTMQGEEQDEEQEAAQRDGRECH